MSFFEPPPPPPQPPEDAPPTPEWIGPPDNVLPASFALDLVLARTDDAALLVHSGRAYQNGFAFTFGLQTRKPREGRADNPMMGWHSASHGGFDDKTVRFGIAFADGRKATVFDAHRWWGDPERPEPPEIVLMQLGGGGGGATWDLGFWVWPLPPEGPVAFVVEWPSERIALTRAELDSAVVRDAAASAVTLWPSSDSGARIWTRRL